MHTPTELSPGDPQQSKRRNVPRKLVQTTLFPVKQKENGYEDSDQKAEKNCVTVYIEEDEDLRGSQKRRKKNPKSSASPQAKHSVKKVSISPAGSKPNSEEENEEDEDFYGSQSKKKKTNRTRASPQEKNSSRKNKKIANGSIPNKNVTSKGLQEACLAQTSGDPIQIEDASHVHAVPDLMLEAKLSSEENFRRSRKKLHPFFSMWKRKPQELNDNGCCSVEVRERGIACGPIHVFESMEDQALPLDWKNWTFCEEPINVNCVPESTCSSVFEDLVGSLKFEKLQRILKSSDSQHLPHSPLPPVSSVLIDRQATTIQSQEDIQMDQEAENSFLHSHKATYLKPSNDKQQSGILEERMMSYYHCSEKEAKNSLWTQKYKPSRAMEVCGNVDTVNFLSNWLRLWHEKYSQTKNASPGQVKHKLRAYDDCSDSLSDPDYGGMDDDDGDDDGADALKNVLLITGPIGSGKSAAVYACTNELGFGVIELSASDLRNGTTVKQNFGEALKSRRLRSGGDHEASLKNIKQRTTEPLGGVTVAKEVDTNMIELIMLSDDECPQRTTNEAFRENVATKNEITCGRGEDQSLILVEDVDIVFPEDRGFIAAIQQIAETSKGPIILTSNRNDPGLPDNFRKLETSFSFPSSKELVSLLHMVCANENIKIEADLLNRFISLCHGDIRKTISHLQFWFQSKNNENDWRVQRVFSNLPFDIENGYLMLPKIFPWSFPSKSSELIDEDISKTVLIIKGDTTLPDGYEVEPYHLEIHDGEKYNLERKKLEMFKQNVAFHGVDLEEDMPGGNEMLHSNLIVTKSLTRHQDYPDLLVNDFTSQESSQAEAVPGFPHDSVKASQAFHVMDECSRIDFRLRSHYIDKTDDSDMVQDVWNKLRNCQYDLRQYSTPEQLDAFHVVKLASGMSNLFSDVDLFTSNCQQEIYEYSEHPLVPGVEDVCTLWNKLIVSTIAEHGFCFFAKEIASVGVKLGGDYKVKLTSEMLATETGTEDLVKLFTRKIWPVQHYLLEGLWRLISQNMICQGKSSHMFSTQSNL